MKITIIGAGNIGSAVAACLAKGHLYNETDIIISTPHTDKLENLHKQFPAIRIMTENQYYSGCQTMYSRRSIISVTIFTHPNPGFTGNRNIYFSPGTFIGNRNAYIPGSSQHRHYGTFEPDPDNFTQSRQRTPATHKTNI